MCSGLLKRIRDATGAVFLHASGEWGFQCFRLKTVLAAVRVACSSHAELALLKREAHEHQVLWDLEPNSRTGRLFPSCFTSVMSFRRLEAFRRTNPGFMRVQCRCLVSLSPSTEGKSKVHHNSAVTQLQGSSRLLLLSV